LAIRAVVVRLPPTLDNQVVVQRPSADSTPERAAEAARSRAIAAHSAARVWLGKSEGVSSATRQQYQQAERLFERARGAMSEEEFFGAEALYDKSTRAFVDVLGRQLDSLLAQGRKTLGEDLLNAIEKVQPEHKRLSEWNAIISGALPAPASTSTNDAEEQ